MDKLVEACMLADTCERWMGTHLSVEEIEARRAEFDAQLQRRKLRMTLEENIVVEIERLGLLE